MSEVISPDPLVTVEGPKLTVSFTRKVGLPNYSNVEAAVYYSVPLAVDHDLTDVVRTIVDNFAPIKVAVYDELGIESSVDDTGIVRESVKAKATRTDATFDSGEATITKLKRAFPGTNELPALPEPAVDGAAPRLQGELRIVGKAKGPIPEWLVAEAAKKGVTKVYDNRDDNGKAVVGNNGKNRPMFADADNKDTVFWGPR